MTLADKLGIDLAYGVKDDEDAELRRKEFGTNKRDPLVAKAWISFWWDQITDTMLIILMCAAIVSIALNLLTAESGEYGLGKSSKHFTFLLVRWK